LFALALLFKAIKWHRKAKALTVKAKAKTTKAKAKA